jgi:hypothetical protein
MATYPNAVGSRDYKLYIPANRTERAPLIVMLHGCTQSPDDFAAGTRMNALAEEHGFLAQHRLANGRQCWNWFQPEDQLRDGRCVNTGGSAAGARMVGRQPNRLSHRSAWSRRIKRNGAVFLRAPDE